MTDNFLAPFPVDRQFSKRLAFSYRPGSIIGHQQDWMEEKQDEMWKQGDAYRKLHKDKVVLDKPVPYPVYSLELKKILLDTMKSSPSSRASSASSSTLGGDEKFTKIVNKVERIKIEDENNGNNPLLLGNDEEDLNNGNSDRPKTMTQGDRLNAIKAKKQQTQSCGNLPLEKLKGHVRVKSVPSARSLNAGVPGSNGNHATTSAALSPSR